MWVENIVTTCGKNQGPASDCCIIESVKATKLVNSLSNFITHAIVNDGLGSTESLIMFER